MPELLFGLNQKTAADLDWPGFLDLAVRLGCAGVEPRNDLGRPVFDGIDPAEAGAMARDRGLRLLGLSEVYPFDDWIAERREAVARLFDQAAAAGAETASLIPRVDGAGPDGPLRAEHHALILTEIAEMARAAGITALVEPIGFPACSIRRQTGAVAAIEAAGASDCIGIVHDTFQHALAEDDTIATGHIRLVHVSGVTTLPLTEALDGARGFIDATDTSGAVAQIRDLLAGGYTGAFSWECTAPDLPKGPALETALARSMTFVTEAVSDALGDR